jgi:hypothetical protein
LSRLRSIIAWLMVYLLVDLGAAALCRRLVPWWDATATERSYRIASEHYHHGLAPNVVTTGAWGGAPYPFRTNSLGFRAGDTGAVALASGRHRTLLLGDSFTEGVGVAYSASYAGLLDQAARTHGGEVLNAAVVSYSPSLYFRKARYYLDEMGLKVDALVVALDVSDPYDEVERYRVSEGGEVVSVEAPEALPRRISLWLRIHTIWGRAIGSLVLAHDRMSRALPVAAGNMPSTWACRGGAITPAGTEGFARAAEGMDSLVSLTRRHRIPMAVFIYPWQDQILRGELRPCHVLFWTEWARSRSIPLVNLFPLFIGTERADSVATRFFIPYDVHWNPAGHRRMADSLLATIVGTLIGAKRASGSESSVAATSTPE